MQTSNTTTSSFRFYSPTSLHSRKRSEEEILRLLSEYRATKNYSLRDGIVLQYANLVESIARRYSSPTEPAEDLAQEGYIGLLSAIEGYDPTKRVKFSTYATHFIIGQIKHYLRDRGKIIKEPAWLQELNQRIVRTTEMLTHRLQRPPDNREIAAEMGMTEDAVSEVMMTREVFKLSSIDGSDSDDDPSGTVDIDRQRAKDVVVSFQLTVEDRIVLQNALQKLKNLEKNVIEAFYFQHLSQTEIAHGLGFSCNYVSHLLRNSIRKMKKILLNDERRDPQTTLNQIRRSQEEEFSLSADDLLVDPLSRLYTRSYFEGRLQEELSWASRERGEVSVVLIQLERLNQYSRGVGTIKADNLILELVKTVRASTRKSDILTRYSADMFALILPYTGKTVTIVEHRLMQSLAKLLADEGADRGLHTVNISLGASIYPVEAIEFETLFQSAMDRLTSIEEFQLPIAA